MQKKNKELNLVYREMKQKKTKGEISTQFMDFEKINLYLGWKPKYQFTKTLPILFRWYKKYFKKR